MGHLGGGGGGGRFGSLSTATIYVLCIPTTTATKDSKYIFIVIKFQLVATGARLVGVVLASQAMEEDDTEQTTQYSA